MRQFSQTFLEGDDVGKRLSTTGLPLEYQQDSIEELDMRVTQLSVDLRDGVRLCGLWCVHNLNMKLLKVRVFEVIKRR